MVAVIVPSGDYESEGRILDELDACAEVKSTMGLANIEAMDGYMLTDAVTPRQLAEMANLDFEVAKALYGAYAVDHDEYGEIINGLDDYKVPIYDMFRFLEQEMHDATSRSRAMCRTRWTTCSTSSMKPRSSCRATITAVWSSI